MSIAGLFLYCSGLSHSENDAHEKIVGFYPSELDQQRQTHLQGVVEGIVSFIGEFFRPNACESIECEHLTIEMIDCGDGFILVLAVQDVNKKVRLQSILDHCFTMFKLLNGRISSYIGSEQGILDLRSRTQRLFNVYGPCISLDSNAMDITGISYLPVDRSIYCHLQSLIKRVELTSEINGRFACVLHGQKLIWSCSDKHSPLYWLEQDRFASLRKEYIRESYEGSTDTRHISVLSFWEEADRSTDCCWAIIVNLGPLCIYYTVDEASLESGRRTLADLELLTLCSRLTSVSKLNSTSHRVRFVYLNGMNLAMKSNLPIHVLESSSQNQFFDIMRSMDDTFRSEEPPLEIVIQSASSRWVIGKRFPETGRVYFLLVDELFTDVDQIEAEIARLQSTCLSSICLA